MKQLLIATFTLLLASAPLSAGLNIQNGNFYITYTDLSFDDANEISRTYNSVGTFNGIFGYGWSSPLEHTLFIRSNGNITFTYNGGGKSVSFKRASGADGTATWVDAGGNAITRDDEGYSVRWKRNNVHNRFDLDGRLLLTESNKGELRRLSYANGVISRIVLGGKHVVEASFYANGKVREFRVKGKPVATYRYGFEDDLTWARNAANTLYRYEYDPKHNMTAIRYESGSSRLLTYSARSHVIAESTEKGCSTRLAYGKNPEAPKQHYWTYKLEICDGRAKSRFIAEYDYRASTTGSGSVTRYWLVPGDYVAESTPRVRYQELVFNRGGRLVGRDNNKSGAIPAFRFDDPLP